MAGLQHFKTTKATDNLTGGDRAVSVRTLGDNGSSSWISAPKNLIVTWGSDGNNTSTGHYYSQVKASKSTLSTVNFYGTWYLGERAL